MLRRVALVRNDVSEEGVTSITNVRRTDELGIRSLFPSCVFRRLVKANVVSSSLLLVTLMMEAIRSLKRWLFHKPHSSQCTSVSSYC
jgi:hypothetical protein